VPARSSAVAPVVVQPIDRSPHLVPFVDGAIWTCFRPLRFFGVDMGTRMTVVRLADGSLFVHSPVAPDDRVLREVAALGDVAHVVAPNKLHHLWVADFAARFPDALVYVSPGLPARRPDLRFDVVLGDEPRPGWTGQLDQCAVTGRFFLDEVAFCHRASGTLVVADLCEEGSAEWPLWSRLLARAGGIWERHGPPRDMKWSFRRDRPALRRAVERILSWDFDRMILAHGRLVESGAKTAFARAYRFALR
jgi:hypothetical protein